MDSLDERLRRVCAVERGFLPIRDEARAFVAANPADACLGAAIGLCEAGAYQARMFGVFVLGMIAHRLPAALALLRERVSRDEDWRVQEILAQAFTQYCGDAGWEAALPVIESWLGDARPNVRRAACEGPRIWTNRDYFKTQPDVAVRLLASLRADESEYVRTSAGNALRDISRKHPDLVRAELSTWNLADPHVRQTHKRAGRLPQRS